MKKIGFIPDWCRGPENEAIVKKAKELTYEGHIDELFLLASPHANIQVLRGKIPVTHFCTMKHRDPVEMLFNHLDSAEQTKEVCIVIVASKYSSARWEAKLNRFIDNRKCATRQAIFHTTCVVNPPVTFNSLRHGYLKNLLLEPLRLAKDLICS